MFLDSTNVEVIKKLLNFDLEKEDLAKYLTEED